MTDMPAPSTSHNMHTSTPFCAITIWMSSSHCPCLWTCRSGSCLSRYHRVWLSSWPCMMYHTVKPSAPLIGLHWLHDLTSLSQLQPWLGLQPTPVPHTGKLSNAFTDTWQAYMSSGSLTVRPDAPSKDTLMWMAAWLRISIPSLAMHSLSMEEPFPGHPSGRRSCHSLPLRVSTSQQCTA
jgi:hypothetical protein